MEFWTNERSISVATVVSLIAKNDLLNKEPITENLIDFYSKNAKKIQTLRETILIEIYEKNPTVLKNNQVKIRDTIENLDPEAFYAFYKTLGTFLWLFNIDTDSISSNLSNCFVTKKKEIIKADQGL